MINGRDGGPRPGIDEDKLDFNQGFVDITPLKSSDHALTVRVGRQLISLGSTRLIATGAGLNVEQPFDGFRFMVHAGHWTADGLAVRPTEVKTGIFDNEPNPAEELWGIYLSRAVPSSHTNVDLYYLGYDHKSARYVQSTGREQRETIGARVWSHTQTWDYDFEYTSQFGTFQHRQHQRLGHGLSPGLHLQSCPLRTAPRTRWRCSQRRPQRPRQHARHLQSTVSKRQLLESEHSARPLQSHHRASDTEDSTHSEGHHEHECPSSSGGRPHRMVSTTS